MKFPEQGSKRELRLLPFVSITFHQEPTTYQLITWNYYKTRKIRETSGCKEIFNIKLLKYFEGNDKDVINEIWHILDIYFIFPTLDVLLTKLIVLVINSTKLR